MLPANFHVGAHCKPFSNAFLSDPYKSLGISSIELRAPHTLLLSDGLSARQECWAAQRSVRRRGPEEARHRGGAFLPVLLSSAVKSFFESWMPFDTRQISRTHI
jgi:hypothetical protein